MNKKSDKERDEIFKKYIYLAKDEADRKYKKLPRCVTYGEILSASYAGLLDAASKYDEKKVVIQDNVAFERYARFRIRGSIKDWLRLCDWGTRNHSRTMITLEGTVLYKDEHGKDFTLKEMLADSKASAQDRINSRQLFAKMIKDLPYLAKKIFHLRYVRDLTMNEIGMQVGLTESRVSQIISEYSLDLYKKLREEKEKICSEM